MRRSGERSGLFGVLAGAVPVAIAVGLVLVAIWRWRVAEASRAPTVAMGAPGDAALQTIQPPRPSPGPARVPPPVAPSTRVTDATAPSTAATEAPASSAARAHDPTAGRTGRPRGTIDELLARVREDEERQVDG